MNKRNDLPVQIKWYNYLPILNEKNISNKFKKEYYPYCTNYPFIKVEGKELQQFESYPFASSFTQEILTYVENCNNNDLIFDEYVSMDDINENVGLTNKVTQYSVLTDVFREMTNHFLHSG